MSPLQKRLRVSDQTVATCLSTAVTVASAAAAVVVVAEDTVLTY